MKDTTAMAVDQQHLVRLLPCPFCGSEAEITDESLPDRPQSWFHAWCRNRPDCNCWLAAGSPEQVAAKWNSRTQSNLERDLRNISTYALGVLQLFDYVFQDEDTGKAEFTGSVSLDWFFHVKRRLEKILSEGNTETND